MTRQILILTTATLLIGCDNINNKSGEFLDSTQKALKTGMNADVANSKIIFTETYKKLLQNSTDTILNRKMNVLYSTINETANYIDSLKTEMNKLDEKDFNNGDLIKKKFLNDGIGDSVFNKIKLSYTFAMDIAIADTTKSRLQKARELFSESSKKQFFELNTPGGVNMILYGIESELIKDGKRSLFGYDNTTTTK